MAKCATCKEILPEDGCNTQLSNHKSYCDQHVRSVLFRSSILRYRNAQPTVALAAVGLGPMDGFAVAFLLRSLAPMQYHPAPYTLRVLVPDYASADDVREALGKFAVSDFEHKLVAEADLVSLPSNSSNPAIFENHCLAAAAAAGVPLIVALPPSATARIALTRLATLRPHSLALLGLESKVPTPAGLAVAWNLLASMNESDLQQSGTLKAAHEALALATPPARDVLVPAAQAAFNLACSKGTSLDQLGQSAAGAMLRLGQVLAATDRVCSVCNSLVPMEMEFEDDVCEACLQAKLGKK